MAFRKWFTSKPDKDYYTEMLKELKAAREKYGLPKGITTVPDRLEISLKRKSYNNFHLSYREYFEYLPTEMLDLVIPNTINFLVQMGMPKDRIVWNPHNCVGVDLDGDLFLIMGVILREVAIQKRFSEEEFDQVSNTSKRDIKSISEFSCLEFEWNEEISRKLISNFMLTMSIIQTNPSALFEFENIMMKHHSQSENIRNLLEKKETKTNTQ